MSCSHNKWMEKLLAPYMWFSDCSYYNKRDTFLCSFSLQCYFNQILKIKLKGKALATVVPLSLSVTWALTSCHNYLQYNTRCSTESWKYASRHQNTRGLILMFHLHARIEMFCCSDSQKSREGGRKKSIFLAYIKKKARK